MELCRKESEEVSREKDDFKRRKQSKHRKQSTMYHETRSEKLWFKVLRFCMDFQKAIALEKHQIQVVEILI